MKFALLRAPPFRTYPTNAPMADFVILRFSTFVTFCVLLCVISIAVFLQFMRMFKFLLLGARRRSFVVLYLLGYMLSVSPASVVMIRILRAAERNFPHMPDDLILFPPIANISQQKSLIRMGSFKISHMYSRMVVFLYNSSFSCLPKFLFISMSSARDVLLIAMSP